MKDRNFIVKRFFFFTVSPHWLSFNLNRVPPSARSSRQWLPPGFAVWNRWGFNFGFVFSQCSAAHRVVWSVLLFEVSPPHPAETMRWREVIHSSQEHVQEKKQTNKEDEKRGAVMKAKLWKWLCVLYWELSRIPDEKCPAGLQQLPCFTCLTLCDLCYVSHLQLLFKLNLGLKHG